MSDFTEGKSPCGQCSCGGTYWVTNNPPYVATCDKCGKTHELDKVDE